MRRRADEIFNEFVNCLSTELDRVQPDNH
jgi:hypothetical protein